MILRRLCLMLAIAGMVSGPLAADEPSEIVHSTPTHRTSVQPAKRVHPALTFAVFEGLVLFNAYLMSLEPQVAGVLLALFGPLGTETFADDPKTLRMGVLTIEALAAYHYFGIDKDDSEGTRFRQSFAAWHAASAILFILQKAHDDRVKKKSVFILPARDGAEIRWVREF